MTAVEDKIPVNNLVEETDYDTKITETEKKLTDHDKYISTQNSIFSGKIFFCKISTSKFNNKDRLWWWTKKSQSKK